MKEGKAEEGCVCAHACVWNNPADQLSNEDLIPLTNDVRVLLYVIIGALRR